MKKFLVILTAISIHTTAAAQTSQQPTYGDLDYSFAALRFVDVDSNGGDGFRLAGSYELDGPWILVGALTALDFNSDVDYTLLEVGGGYVWDYSRKVDIVSTLRLVRAEVDTPFGGTDDTGFAISAGARGYISPSVEIRGSVNHLNLDDSDTYLQLAGDYYFSRQVSAGISLDFGGDLDTFTIGARWFFR